MSTPAHALYSPSTFNRLMACAGSHSLAAHFPEILEDEDEGDGDAAAEGTAAHWVVEQLLTLGTAPKVTTIAPNGVPVSREMVEGAHGFAGYVREQVGAVELMVERRVACGKIHFDCWGTMDLGARVRQMLARVKVGNHVFDYKFGFNYVSEFENWQLIAYMGGLLEEGTLEDAKLPLHMHIYQPRAYGREIGRCWSPTYERFTELHARLAARIQEIAAGRAVECVTSEYCHYCPARRGCPALQAAAQHAAQISRMAVPLELSNADAGVELSILRQAAKALEYRVKGLESQVEHVLFNGGAVPYFELQNTQGRQRWKEEPAKVIAFGKLLGVNFAREAEPITPTEAQKIAPDPAMLAFMIERPTGRKLAETNPDKLRRIFSGE